MAIIYIPKVCPILSSKLKLEVKINNVQGRVSLAAAKAAALAACS